jgi:hypothetical protein
MREATANRILEALKKEKGERWLTINALAAKSESHYYAILVFVAQNKNKLERVTFGSRTYIRLKV